MSEYKESTMNEDTVREPTAGMQYGDPEGLATGLDEKQASGGYVLDATKAGAAGQNLQTAADGRTILIPQPSSDPNDPLNWTPFKKNLILFVFCVAAFMPDFGSAIAIVTVLPQAKQWKVSQNVMEHDFAFNLIALAASSILSVVSSNYFGRLPTLVYFLAIALGTCAWSAAATSEHSFLVARVFYGLFAIVSQSCGLMYIQDIYFFHEHPRKINIWSGAYILSPHLGNLFTSFIVYYKKWPDAYWVATGVAALAFLIVLAFMDETIYNRGLDPRQQPVPKSRALRLIGVEQWRSRRQRQPFLAACLRPVIALSKVPVLLCVIYGFLNFAWFIGTDASITVFLSRDYHFNTYNLGMFYFSPIIGTVLGTVIGHWLHDFIGRIYVVRHAGRMEPEARLIIIWLATPIIVVCILIVGFALQNGWHWSIIAVFFAGHVMGIVIESVAINAYLLASYPEGSGEMGALISVGRATGGFMATYIQLDWVAKSGYQHTFGTQAGIAAASGLLIAGIGIWGKRMRKWQGPMTFGMKTGYETQLTSEHRPHMIKEL